MHPDSFYSCFSSSLYFIDLLNIGLISSLNKQRGNKYDQLGMGASQQQQQHSAHSLLLNNNNSNTNSSQSSRLQNYHRQNPDDELDFDPFFETQKGLAELLEHELGGHQRTQSPHSKLMESCALRARLPQPSGFSHMNAFGIGVPRAPPQTSKILPFMNMNGGNAGNNQQSTQNGWGHHQQQNMGFSSLDQSQNHHLNNKGGNY